MLDSIFISGPLPSAVERGVYQLPLVALSYIVASFASFAALSLAQQVTTAKTRREKRLLQSGGAFAMGAGIWSMHFIGMLSYKMDMVVQYDPWLTLLSMLFAIAASYVALKIVARRALSYRQLAIGAVLMGIGICGMHYTGMAAMKMDAYLRYIPFIFLLSVAIAISASAAALWIAFTLARHASLYRYFFQVGAALVMGAAICGMHYTGMAAAVFVPFLRCRYDPFQDFHALAIAIAIITGIVLLLALGVGFYRQAQTEARLMNSENRLRLMLDGALDAIVGMDQTGIITEWNRRAEILFGWPAAEAAGKKLSELIIPPEFRARHEEGMRRFLADGTGPILNRQIEVEALDRNGRLIPVELAVAYQKLYDGSYHFTAFVRDITERRRAEEDRRRYTKSLEDSNRELDDFAYIASHDLKEPLRGMHNFAKFMLQDYSSKLDADGVNMLNTIARLSRRMDEMLTSLLDYSRVGRTETSVRETDLNQLAHDALAFHAIKIKETGTIVEIPQPLPVIVCDHVRITEVYNNLIGNALKYSDGGERKIELGWTRSHPDRPGEAVFYVRDNGIGIDKKNLDGVFKIFRR
ncbi:MAG TPA: MHYT domain-containing protein, partial [Patescibacteria group bacterium]|nr:MHYT domain-containing protein [Patescibacteria group bacterium]